MDHLAVRFFLKGEKVDSLYLCLPAKFDFARCQFIDTGEVDWRKNPGGTSNHYHRKFSREIYGDENASLLDLKAALQNEFCTVVYEDGFFARNNLVAKRADKVFALTFGKGNIPEDGGTAHTWSEFIKLGKPAHHVSLSEID